MSQLTEAEPLPVRLKILVSNLLQKYRTALIVVVAAAVIVVVGLAIGTQIDVSVKNDYAVKIGKSQEDYSAWLAADDTKKPELAAVLEKELVGIESTAPHGYGLTKAWFLHGQFLAEQHQWKDASTKFAKAADVGGSLDLGPVAKLNQAVCLEEAGDLAGALSAYAALAKDQTKDALLTPQALFSMGRIQEAMGKGDDAKTSYGRIPAQFPNSTWAKLARDRLLAMNP